jgi:hypothetical protein
MRAILVFASVATVATSAWGSIPIDPNWSIARQWNEGQLHAIRLSTPRPPVHARNLYHVNAAMYDAWATYSQTERGVYFHEKHVAGDVSAARREAISYAAYRVLKGRYVAGNGPNVPTIQADFDALFAGLGYDAGVTTTSGNTPAAIGNRIASVILGTCFTDGSNEANNYAPNNGYEPVNAAMPFKIPGTSMSNPNRWQPLNFDFLVLQNGQIIGQATQTVVCPHWDSVTPFGMNSFNRNPQNGLYFDQGAPPLIGSQAMRDQAIAMLEHSVVLDPEESFLLDTSPAVWGNSPLGSYEQPGYGLNPVTGQPYKSNLVNFADYTRANAEFWADGADSETPPGHWHVIANMLSDHPSFEHKLYGQGPSLDRLEWDVKMYVLLGGAVHDASITAWGMKGDYDSSRPISFVRYMGQSGQSSDPKLPSYHPDGLPLIPGLVRIVQPEDVAPGGELEDLVHLVYEPLSGEPIGVDDHVGDIVVRSWLGGFSAGTTTGVQVTGPIPGHIYRTDSGWQVGDWTLGADDTPGALNSGLTLPGTIKITEARNAQKSADTDEYVEISGPPGTSLNNIWFVVIGDEVQSGNNATIGIPDAQGRVQVAVNLTGHSIQPNGTFLIGRSTLSLATPNLVNLLNLKEIGNTTYALMTNFTGYPGLELDLFDDGILDTIVWSSVIDAVGLRRNSNAAGIYFGAPTVGPVNSQTQLYGVGWQLASTWMTYQASNFVTPPFPGFTSGHSTFSRAAAEALTKLTGSPYFPGGLMEYTIPEGWLKFEDGPSQDVVLNWVKFGDLADQAGESRIWGGIHPPIDDIAGRLSGYQVGLRAAQRAKALYKGHAVTTDIDGNGMVSVSDLLALLSMWGPCPAPCPGDINGDGNVGVPDLIAIITEWGPSN